MTIFLFFFVPQILFGQAGSVEKEQSRVNNMNQLMQGKTSSLMLYYQPSDIKGSKFFYNEYVTGELWFTNGDSVSTGYLFKFDESENSVQTKDKNGQELLLNVAKISGCRLNIEGKTVLYYKAEVPNEMNVRHLYQVIHNSEMYQIVKLPAKKLITKTKVFHDDPERIEYVEQHRYFLKKGKGEFKELKLKKKGLLVAFPDKTALISRLLETPQYKGELTEAGLAGIISELDKMK